MQAMILAAGKGTRMRPLTANIPKALVMFKNKSLIEHLIINLKNFGIDQLIINLHYLGEQIKQTLGNGNKFGVKIKYSEEPNLLDTGGGIVKAITSGLLNQEPFVVISADIFTEFNFSDLFTKLSQLAHLVLVPNPSYHLSGDFSLNNNDLQSPHNNPEFNFTYANIGIFDPDFFLDPPGEVFPLGSCINRAIKNQQITAEIYSGLWRNIGTLEELYAASQ